MSADQPQFDIFLGGSEELPQDLAIMKYASARAQEILSLTEALQEPRKTGLVFQRLPRHMRRRVMSHNAKRMPRNLREAHIRQMEKSGLPPKSKRPSRKYRRRPSNLLEAYNRRQREFIWLETHIWHAKRFHMTSKWGYKLANFPNDKSARSCYRGAANHCLIQDISYYICIELKGEFECITNGLKMLTRKECGLTFGAKAWQKGDREGSVTLFHHDSKYPYGAIGRVLFLWKPTTTLENTKDICKTLDSDVDIVAKSGKKRTIWIWVHPSFYDEVKDELVKVFEMDLCPSVEDEGTNEEPPHKKVKLDCIKLKSKNESKLKQSNLETLHNKEGSLKPSYRFVPHYEGNCVKMTLLKDTLVRFRLTGPLSQAILRETFLLAPLKGDEKVDFPWWMHWRDVFKCQREIWEDMAGITSPAIVSPHTVLGLTILDPRCNLPEKRTKAADLDYVSRCDMLQGCLPPEASTSPIWIPEIRDYVTKFKPTDAEVNKKQSNNLVPGVLECGKSIEGGSQEQESCVRVPILLIQRPGSQDSTCKRLGYCAGWDVIAPAGWGKPLWLGLILRGARAGGLREAEMVEDIGFSQMFSWPALPDTNAAKVEMKHREREAKEKYFRLPTNKRPNFVKLGISSPFSCPWDILCREWSNSNSHSGLGDADQNTHYVLRDLQKLRQISEVLCEIKKERSAQGKIAPYRMEKRDSEEPGEKDASFTEWLSLSQCSNDHCLIPIRVTLYKKGTIKDFAVVCLPIKEDIVNHKGKRSPELKGPEEPINLDPNQEERKILRKEHKKNLVRLRRKRVKQHKEANEFTLDELNPCAQEESEQDEIPRRPPLMGPAATVEIREKHKNRMEELFMPPVTEARRSCSREVAGYVTHGVFSLSDAKEIGMAYVALPALHGLLKTKFWNPELLVFVRNTYCKHYIPAKVEIVTN